MAKNAIGITTVTKTTTLLWDIDEIIAAKGLAIVEDTGAIDAAIAVVLSRSEKAIADFKSGNEKAIGALIGQVMKQVKGADPQAVREKLLTVLSR